MPIGSAPETVKLVLGLLAVEDQVSARRLSVAVTAPELPSPDVHVDGGLDRSDRGALAPIDTV